VSDDPYVYPGTDVLRNIRGIRDGGELEKFEGRLTFLRSLQLASKPIVGEYDLAHLRAFHRYRDKAILRLKSLPKTGSPDVSVGHVTVTLPGRGGHNPPNFSIAREISA
jgi:hypothetical protein